MLELDPAARLPPACQAYEKAISLGGMSKTFAMPGLRIGWLAMQDESLLKYVNLGPCVSCADVNAGIVFVLRILITCVPRFATPTCDRLPRPQAHRNVQGLHYDLQLGAVRNPVSYWSAQRRKGVAQYKVAEIGHNAGS
jgi:aspartate/methionine/tyrosine aminotransferase